MLSIEVNFLTGRYVATAHYDRSQSEWPPHPARLFSAMVAAWADSDQPDPAERAALEWLETQSAPSICASGVAPRSAATHYVPVNDASIITGGYKKLADKIDRLISHIEEARSKGDANKLRTLEAKLGEARNVSTIVASVDKTVESAVDIMPPGWVIVPGHARTQERLKGKHYGRTGQSREYPSVTPEEPRVTFIWEATPERGTATTIDGLCARLTRLGHSSSLVSCRVTPDHPAANHVPGEGAAVLRSVRSGQLAALEREYRKHQGSKPRTLPFTSTRYRKAGPASTEEPGLKPDTSGEWLVLEFRPGSRRFPSTMTVAVAKTLRDAVFHYATDPMPEGLSGHRREGRPSTAPHAAFLPLPWVGHEHADGRLMGAAVSMPDILDAESRRAALRAIGKWEEAQQPLTLTLGRRGVIKMERVVGPSPLATLRPDLWSRKSHRWVSVVPIALPAHPGALGAGTPAARSKAWARAEQAVVDSCRHIGLPEPADVAVSLAPLITGARPAGAFPAFLQGGRQGKPIARRLVHASVFFDRPVAGPVMLGAGRYLGLGLMRPVWYAEEAADA